jgi:hypothetical protein
MSDVKKALRRTYHIPFASAGKSRTICSLGNFEDFREGNPAWDQVVIWPLLAGLLSQVYLTNFE